MLDELKVAVNAAKLAGDLLKPRFNHAVKINSSIDKDIKLQSDLDAEKVILDYLEENSSHSILSEESGQINSEGNDEYRWIVDPLDGSLNFSRAIFINCISIGLWKGMKPVLGVIYDFTHGDLYTGVIGDHAALNGDQITVSKIKEVSKSIICTGFPVYSDFSSEKLSGFINEIQSFKKVRLLGSAAMSLALVSRGSVEAYKEDNIAIWDVAAGIPIVIAAGGVCDISMGKRENLLNVFAKSCELK